MNNDSKQGQKQSARRKRGTRTRRSQTLLLRQPRPVRGQLYFDFSYDAEKGDEHTIK